MFFFPPLSSDKECSITGSSSRSEKFKPFSPKTREPYIKSTSTLTLNKPKLTVLGNSMVRNTGPIVSDTYKEADSTVYSIYGLSIDIKLVKWLKTFSLTNRAMGFKNDLELIRGL